MIAAEKEEFILEDIDFRLLVERFIDKEPTMFFGNKNFSLSSESIETCRCIEEPRGRNGLEGYVYGETYFCERCKADKNGKQYWRIWPESHDDSEYYETCGTGTFSKFFVLL
jgi:hypothetical protein